MRLKRVIGTLFATCLCMLAVQAKITLPSILGNGMVLQQQTTVRLWGKATPNQLIKLTTSWDSKLLKTHSKKDGSWEITLRTPLAGGPYRIEVSDGEAYLLEDILIGEVWLCSGQSNMEMPVKGFRGQPVEGSHRTIVSAQSDRPLRLFTVKRAFSKEPQTDVTGLWMKNNSEAVADFSATAYYFGSQLQEKLGVPVGLIHASWSASKIEPWMDEETLKAFPEIDLSVLNQTTFQSPNATPTLLFNAMIKPLEPLSLKGVIWYQGESNSLTPDLYQRLFAAWINQLRQLFRSPELPIYYVQLAPYQSSKKEGLQLPLFREKQLQSMQQVPHTGMAFTTDLGSEQFIHPPYKQAVGERLAFWALAKTYEFKGFSYCGPVFQSSKTNGSAVELTFDYADEGLNPEKADLLGFEIAGADSVFLPARAMIINGTSRVKVWNESVAQPMEVRYCFRNYLEGNLQNNAGLPAASFRIRVMRAKIDASQTIK